MLTFLAGRIDRRGQVARMPAIRIFDHDRRSEVVLGVGECIQALMRRRELDGLLVRVDLDSVALSVTVYCAHTSWPGNSR